MRHQFGVTAGRLADSLLDRYHGEVVISRRYDRPDGDPSAYHIDRADPRVWIAGPWLRMVRAPVQVLHVDRGVLVRIPAADRTVVYRLAYYDTERDLYLAVWPD